MTKMMRTDGSATCLASKGKPEFSPQQNILREQKDSLPLKHALFLFEKNNKTKQENTQYIFLLMQKTFLLHYRDSHFADALSA